MGARSVIGNSTLKADGVWSAKLLHLIQDSFFIEAHHMQCVLLPDPCCSG